MKTKLTSDQKLALYVGVISFLALFVSAVASDGWKDVNQRPNYISVIELAEQIKGRKNIQLIDLRASDAYEEFHLPTAATSSLESYSSLEIGDSKVVLYSVDNQDAIALWRSLDENAKMKTYVLYGGINDWYNKLLYPKNSLKVDGTDSAIVEKVMSLTKFYGGSIEVVDDNTLLDYYRLDIGKVKRKYVHQEGVLRRKGC